uniref:Uncharacterized protein n=1 Tax=Ananas comosus var. bracteatus TaxID=296719 RepID=A0A6V7PN48_ANACO|nr:unnamed protein product [Ananas comosus var. bracteatus]
MVRLRRCSASSCGGAAPCGGASPRKRPKIPPTTPQRALALTPRSPPLLRTHIPSPSPASHSDRSFAFYALAGTLASSVAAAAYLSSSSSSSAADHRIPSSDQIYADLEKTLEASKSSVRRVVDQMRQTGAAAAVLWKSLASVMSSANQEVRSGFELRVAALLADIAAANSARRAAIVGAGAGPWWIGCWTAWRRRGEWSRAARDAGGGGEGARAAYRRSGGVPRCVGAAPCGPEPP